jgi:hypothetical protein
MAKKLTQKEYTDITRSINEIAEEINLVLNSRSKERYFEEIIMLYSFIENLLKWLVFVKILWQKSDKELTQKEANKLRSFCKKLNFYNALYMAFSIDLIDFSLYKRIDMIREERNNVIHQFWMYSHRNNLLVLRKKLEKLAGVASQLVGIFNQLTQEVGVDEVYEIFL